MGIPGPNSFHSSIRWCPPILLVVCHMNQSDVCRHSAFSKHHIISHFTRYHITTYVWHTLQGTSPHPTKPESRKIIFPQKCQLKGRILPRAGWLISIFFILHGWLWLRTILASIIASLFMFLGLLTLSLGELESQLNQRDLTVSNPLVWRWMGWTFLFYIPIMWTAAPFVRNYAVWGLQPCQSFSDAYRKGHETSKWLRVLRSSRKKRWKFGIVFICWLLFSCFNVFKYDVTLLWALWAGSFPKLFDIFCQSHFLIWGISTLQKKFAPSLRRSLLVPCSLQVIFMTVYSLLISVPVAGEHFGIFPIFVLSNVLSI